MTLQWNDREIYTDPQKYKTTITLYHGSGHIIRHPRLDKGVGRKDFGPGFYTTEDRRQAENFVRSLFHKNDTRILGLKNMYVNKYELKLDKELDIKVFQEPGVEWLEFLVLDDKLKPNLKHDIIIGPTADDQARTTLNLFKKQVAAKGLDSNLVQYIAKRLKTENLSEQYCIKTEKALRYLVFKGVETVE